MKKIILSLSFFGFLVSCQPDPNSVTGNTALLTRSNGWLFSSITVDTTNNNLDDGIVITNPCYFDSYEIYNTNETTHFFEGTLICNGSSNSSRNWKWDTNTSTPNSMFYYWNNGETLLTARQCNVLKLTADSLVFNCITPFYSVLVTDGTRMTDYAKTTIKAVAR